MPFYFSTAEERVQRSVKWRGCLLSYSQAEPGRELTQPSLCVSVEPCTPILEQIIHRFRECCRKSRAEAECNSLTKIHQTWCPPFSRAIKTKRNLWVFTRSMRTRREITLLSPFLTKLSFVKHSTFYL